MADAPPPLGVLTERPMPPCPPPEPPPEPPLWPPAAQWGTAALLAACVALLAWHGYGLSPYSARPLAVEEAALPPVDLNRAAAADLALLPGVGPVLAERIVEHRRIHGPFRSVEDLRRVPGVGPATLERVEHFLVVGPYAPEAPRVARGARPEEPPPRMKKPPPAEPIDINRASAQELQRLPGIGPTLSARIVEARRERPFRSVDELRRVKGIGVKTLERLRPHVRAGE